MPDYAIFGGVLQSEIVFPDLPVARGQPPDWTLQRVEMLPDSETLELLGSEEVGDGITVRLFRHREGHRLVYDDTGTFDISAGGRTILWCAPPDASDAKARLDVIGRVLALALHVGGIVALHGSAVAFAGGAVAFVAPKYHGKSTLAAAAVASGARLLTDDTVAVALDPEPLVRPGVHHVRLFGDSSERLVGRSPHDPADKEVVSDYTAAQLADAAVPLAAIYLLSPMNPETFPAACRRVRLGAIPAALALVRHAKLGELLGASGSAMLLESAAAVSSAAKVYRLEFPRDYARLDEVVTQLGRWHDGRGESEVS